MCMHLVISSTCLPFHQYGGNNLAFAMKAGPWVRVVTENVFKIFHKTDGFSRLSTIHVEKPHQFKDGWGQQFSGEKLGGRDDKIPPQFASAL